MEITMLIEIYPELQNITMDANWDKLIIEKDKIIFINFKKNNILIERFEYSRLK